MSEPLRMCSRLLREGLLSISFILIMMKELVTQTASDTLGTNERNAIKSEIDEFSSEVGDIVSRKHSSTELRWLMVPIPVCRSRPVKAPPIRSHLRLLRITAQQACRSLQGMSQIISRTPRVLQVRLRMWTVQSISINTSLQQIGATISRLTIKEMTLSISITNTEVAKARILDADIAKEQLESTRFQILRQTAAAQLTQSNVIPQNVLALFT